MSEKVNARLSELLAEEGWKQLGVGNNNVVDDSGLILGRIKMVYNEDGKEARHIKYVASMRKAPDYSDRL